MFSYLPFLVLTLTCWATTAISEQNHIDLAPSASNFVFALLEDAAKKNYISTASLDALRSNEHYLSLINRSPYLESLLVQARSEHEGRDKKKLKHFISVLMEQQATATQGLSGGGKTCPKWNEQICNGEKRGLCESSSCKCIGGWSGQACQTAPAVRNFNPMKGDSEPNAECSDMLHRYINDC